MCPLARICELEVLTQALPYEEEKSIAVFKIGTGVFSMQISLDRVGEKCIIYELVDPNWIQLGKMHHLRIFCFKLDRVGEKCTICEFVVQDLKELQKYPIKGRSCGSHKYIPVFVTYSKN